MIPDQSKSGERILVVDDNRQLLQVIRIRLELDGFDVIASESGDEAAELLKNGESLDILLTDAVMPGDVQGLDLARYLKMHQPGTPVVLMSGYLGENDVGTSLGREIDCFLPKPLKLSELRSTLSELVRPLGD